MSDLRDLYQDLIIDHSRNPRHFGKLETADYSKEGYNPLCGDKVVIYFCEHTDQIHQVQFEGTGCAISMASASLMTEALIGKTRVEIDTLFADFHHLVTTGSPPDNQHHLEKLLALAGVAEYPMRVKCATLPWHTALAALRENQPIPILKFSSTALAHIQKMMARSPHAKGFRLSVKQAGCTGYKYVPEITESPLQGDVEITIQGLNIFIDSAWLNIIKGTQVDLIEKGLGQQQLQFNNPNVQGECGCGESFFIKKESDL